MKSPREPHLGTCAVPSSAPNPSPQVLSDDAHLMAASEDRSWTIWDIGQERVTRLFRADMGAVRGLDMAPDQVGPYNHVCCVFVQAGS